MNNKMTFGKYEGKNFEWIFFKDAGYVEWILEHGIDRQDHFGEEQSDYFEELYQRATHLSGTCRRCKERPITRMGLTTSFKNHELLAVGFYCDECEYRGGAATGYYPPAFFVEAYTLEPGEQKMVINEVRRHYIGTDGNLTQKKMEMFFHNDENFSDCTAGFFNRLEVVA